MSLSKELAELQRQRSEEVRVLHRTYLRTKRDVQRAVSPARIVRKHMGTSLAAAVALGIMLAPGGASHGAAHQESNGAGTRGWRRFSLPWAKKIITRFFPEAAAFLPDDPETPREESAEPKKEKSGPLLRLIKVFAPLLLSKIDWHKLINDAMHGIHQKMQSRGAEGQAAEPNVSPADAESVPAHHEYENFDGAERPS